MTAVLLSLGAAITFALSAMFVAATAGRLSVFQLARWQMGLAFVALAALCGSRARFVAIAPVITWVLSALSGSMIPRILLPSSIASVCGWLFPAWAIDACSAAIDGRFDGRSIGLLTAMSVASTLVALFVARRSAHG